MRHVIHIRLTPENSNSHRFELHRPSIKGTKLLLKVIKAIIIINESRHIWKGHVTDFNESDLILVVIQDDVKLF